MAGIQGMNVHMNLATVTAVAGMSTAYRGFVMPRLRADWPVATAPDTQAAIHAIVTRIMISGTSYRGQAKHLAYGVGELFLRENAAIATLNAYEIPGTVADARLILNAKIRTVAYNTDGNHDPAMVAAITAAWPNWNLAAAVADPANVGVAGVAGEGNPLNNPLGNANGQVIVEEILNRDVDGRNYHWAFSYIAVFFAAMSKRGAVTQDWVTKYIAGIRDDSGFVHDPYVEIAAISDSFRCYSPAFDPVTLFPHMLTLLPDNCLRLRLTVKRVAFSGMTTLQTIRDAILAHPTFNWSGIKDLWPREWAAFKAAVPEMRPYSAFGQKPAVLNNNNFPRLAWVCKELMVRSGSAPHLRKSNSFAQTVPNRVSIDRAIDDYLQNTLVLPAINDLSTARMVDWVRNEPWMQVQAPQQQP